jgi:hypothetical protein
MTRYRNFFHSIIRYAQSGTLPCGFVALLAALVFSNRMIMPGWRNMSAQADGFRQAHRSKKEM